MVVVGEYRVVIASVVRCGTTFATRASGSLGAAHGEVGRDVKAKMPERTCARVDTDAAVMRSAGSKGAWLVVVVVVAAVSNGVADPCTSHELVLASSARLDVYSTQQASR